ncbi:MAG: hypothetical protein HY538_04105 [Deltaproteobacteria bacterium]|nr:hypothetical protein [Deltaproteobacteria bacterium]
MRTLILGLFAILLLLGGCGKGGDTVTREDTGIGETPSGGTAISESYQMSNAGVGASQQTVSSKSYEAKITVGSLPQQTSTSSNYKLKLFSAPQENP